VREGRSFNPDEFAIALEQVVAGTAPQDYTNPADFFARTCFTKALSEHSESRTKIIESEAAPRPSDEEPVPAAAGAKTIILTGIIPPELWKRSAYEAFQSCAPTRSRLLPSILLWSLIPTKWQMWSARFSRRWQIWS